MIVFSNFKSRDPEELGDTASSQGLDAGLKLPVIIVGLCKWGEGV